MAAAADATNSRERHGYQQLAAFCLHALTAAGNLPSAAAVGRLIDVTLSGLRPSVAG